LVTPAGAYLGASLTGSDFAASMECVHATQAFWASEGAPVAAAAGFEAQAVSSTETIATIKAPYKVFLINTPVAFRDYVPVKILSMIGLASTNRP
jgi:hypothetical protein